MQKPKPEKQKKNLKSVRHFRLSEEDAKDWDAKVAASGMTESAFIRLAVIQNKTVVQAAKTKQTTLEQRKILFLFAQQSNNINQLAHQVNTAHRAGKITPDLYLAVLEQLQSINQIAKDWVS
ncbi:plasmid mobilization relaxosome protein MobC [Undibacterium sp. TS12]|uniref:plasmid mobilization protein n=1 Tax=Undibacterium sp. TS12 TaxID=2908202 RepID=UPI001F4C9F69|nr:plasmid mobilization relaxosome protein MobC [Undibacterium sp. TS12]MCH8622955.1 plasmid mobilization relaxosome protein MobC [Undibacterium sp. TS12]